MLILARKVDKTDVQIQDPPLYEKTGCFFVYHDFICVLTGLVDFINRLLLLKRRITWKVLVVKSRMK